MKAHTHTRTRVQLPVSQCLECMHRFDEFQTDISSGKRNPKCDNLYDVFVNIRDDEAEHVKTMNACQDSEIMDEIVERREKTRRV